MALVKYFILLMVIFHSQVVLLATVNGLENSFILMKMDTNLGISIGEGTFNEDKVEKIQDTVSKQTSVTTVPITTTTVPSTTTTAVPTTTTAVPTTTPPMVCLGYTLYQVEDYSEAEKSLFETLTNATFDDCCSYETNTKKYESFSFENGECQFYRYSPNRDQVWPSPQNDGNDKILYLFTPTDTSCSYEEVVIHHDSFIMHYNENCLLIDCFEGQIGHMDAYFTKAGLKCFKFGNVWTDNINIYLNIETQEEATDVVNRIILENIYSAYYTLTFSGDIRLDAFYNEEANAYQWSRTKGSVSEFLTWEENFPTTDKLPCVLITPEGTLKDILCDAAPSNGIVRF